MKLPPGYVPGQGTLKPTGYGGFGERMLRSMGWQTGQGLGRNNDGIKEAIQVKKKEDTVGVGGNASWKWDEKYWEVAYESVQLTNQDSDSSDSSDSSDDEDGAAFAAAAAAATATVSMNRDGTLSSASAQELRLLKSLSKGPATGRFGGREAKMARIREQEAKLAAEYAARLGVSVTTTQATATTATTATTTAAAGAAGGSDASDTTTGEVGGRLSGGAAAPAEEADSGEQQAASGAKGAKQKRKRDKGSGKSGKGGAEAGGGGGEEEGEGSGKQKKKKKRRNSGSEAEAAEGQQQQQQEQQGGGSEAPAQPRQRIVIEPAVKDAAPVAEFKPTPTAGWWGSSRFVSAGSLEGAKKDVQGGKERMEFNEADQERVYMAAHNNQVKRGTKKGLGQSTAVGPVGGAKWAGSRVTFQDEEEEVQEDEKGEKGKQRAPRLAAIGSSTHLDTLGAAAAPSSGTDRDGAGSDGSGGEGSQQQQQQQQQGEGEAEWQGRVKWHKLIGRVLKAAPGGKLKLKQLQKEVAAAALEKLGGGGGGGGGSGKGAAAPGKKEVQAAVAAKVGSSSRYEVDGKYVRLKSGGGGGGDD